MASVGIIAEYNPFHNGHLYHLNKVKEMFKDHEIIVILGGNFLQRGEISVLDKWDKTTLALKYGADLVVELPFPFATQSADIFAKGAISLLNHLNIDYLVFGSESNDLKKLTNIAKAMNSSKYNVLLKKNIDLGLSYPSANSKAIASLTNYKIKTPNDILGIAYIKEIMLSESNIKPLTIKRTNDYHNKDLLNSITSATSIREALKNNQNIKKYVPTKTFNLLKNYQILNRNFDLLKYQILNNFAVLNEFLGVDEGIEYKILKKINQVNSLDELIKAIKSKRYTYNRLNRMFTHILLSYTKKENQRFSIIEYIRILGFNKKGQAFLKKHKKDITLPIVTTYSKNNHPMLKYEEKISNLYYLINNLDRKEEHKQKIIII
ncbi:MAG: nucleotidyltransferase [Tenericutes bacterium]|nr:nucleotidyltransferase [Mycoplasmatota bacterium]